MEPEKKDPLQERLDREIASLEESNTSMAQLQASRYRDLLWKLLGGEMSKEQVERELGGKELAPPAPEWKIEERDPGELPSKTFREPTKFDPKQGLSPEETERRLGRGSEGARDPFKGQDH